MQKNKTNNNNKQTKKEKKERKRESIKQHENSDQNGTNI